VAAEETGFSDVVYNLVSVQYHALKGGYVYGQYARDAEEEGHPDIAEFFRQVKAEDAARAEKCQRFLFELASTNSKSNPRG
jgi:rubrerythrin